MNELVGFPLDVRLLQEFERGLDPSRPECSKVPARILGYGEISTVLEIQLQETRGLACKRLPIFRTVEEMQRYRATYLEYNRLLTQSIGLRLPPHGYAAFTDDGGHPIFYILQQQLPSESVGSRAIHALSTGDVLAFVHHVLRELRRVWDFNRAQRTLQVAIDGQISNWAIAGLDPRHPHFDPEAPIYYLDTSTPLYRSRGVEQLDPELFLRSAPSFLVWLLRWLFLKDVVNRYYDLHLVAVDLVANFYKEQRPELIPDLVALVNSFFAGEAASLGIKGLTEQEVRSYYRQDALIWSLYLAMRKVDRTLRAGLLRQRYPYILPDKVQR